MCIWIELFLISPNTAFSFIYTAQIHRETYTTALPCSPSLCRSRHKTTWPTSMTTDWTVHTLAHGETQTRALTRTRSAPINVIEEQRRGKQNFCRKPEVAYATIPPALAIFAKPLSPPGSEVVQPDAAS